MVSHNSPPPTVVSGLTAFSPGSLKLSSGLYSQMLKHHCALSKVYGGFMLTNGDSSSWTVVSDVAALTFCLSTNNQWFHTYKFWITISNSGLWLHIFSPIAPITVSSGLILINVEMPWPLVINIQWFHAEKCWIPFSDSGLAAFSSRFIRNIQRWMQLFQMMKCYGPCGQTVVSGRAAFRLGIASLTIASTSWCQRQLINM